MLFEERPRKVHLFKDHGGELMKGTTRPYANTLCKGNFPGPELRTTNDPAKVTCRICKRKMDMEDNRHRRAFDQDDKGTRDPRSTTLISATPAVDAIRGRTHAEKTRIVVSPCRNWWCKDRENTRMIYDHQRGRAKCECAGCGRSTGWVSHVSMFETEKAAVQQWELVNPTGQKHEPDADLLREVAELREMATANATEANQLADSLDATWACAERLAKTLEFLVDQLKDRETLHVIVVPSAEFTIGQLIKARLVEYRLARNSSKNLTG